jgi:multisubunit Na+/H+ antiporter MnhB subunit
MEDGGTQPTRPAWLRKQAEKEAKREAIASKDRMVELVPIAGTLLVTAFVAIHQTRPTGFLTGDAGLAALVLYLMLVVGLVPMLIRLVAGRRNLSRLFEIVGMAVFFVGQLYLLVKFPFDFSHFAEPLPHSLEFLLDWVSATLAKVILGIGVVGSAVFAVYTFFLYLAVRDRLSRPAAPELETGQ